jgi:hypothetical protein
VDWTYSDKKPRTIEERRRLVQERIQKEQTRAGVDTDFAMPGTQEAAAAPEASAFLCPENDKNAQNVVNSGMDDKNAQNVVTLQNNTVQDNNTVHTEKQDIHTDTHTQQQATGYAQPVGAPPVTCQDTNAVGVENIQTENTEIANIPTAGDVTCGDDASTLAEMALREAKRDVEDTGQASLVGYLNDFFVKNCYGFKKNQSAAAINTLAGKILELSDAVNPPGTVAGLLCSEFKKMCEGQREKYWDRMPLLPANMIKPRAWAELVQYAGKILATNQNSERFMQAAEKAQKEYEAEKELVGDAMRDEYLKYNIDPEDPQAQKLLLVAKSREHEATRNAKEDPVDNLPPGTDIF